MTCRRAECTGNIREMDGVRARNVKVMRNQSIKKSGKANESLGSVLMSTA
jgi:hypothetical protein